jgi:hypothetical protein
MTVFFAALVVVAAVLVAAPFVGAATNVHTAVLNGSAAFPAVNGKAKFGVDNGIRELEVQIEDANALKGERLNVRIDGKFVGSMTVNNLGNARLRKTGSVVPAVQTGSKIVVRRALNGQLVASGTFN